jgi:hypothetical protein
MPEMLSTRISDGPRLKQEKEHLKNAFLDNNYTDWWINNVFGAATF